ncbi:MAG: hypothetical protein LBF13_01415 [Campylobacteraceae bacterium]|jgi:hypothetical protein|nr:hypothetical protein [Campylobacteraceae bacterium]
MALPIFIAGVAVGGLAVVALKNRVKIAEELKSGIEKAKKFAEDSLQKTKKPQKEMKKANSKRREKPKAQETQNVTDN